MSKLIEALNIFLKYGDPAYPTHCEHDVLSIMIDPAIVSDEDKAKLEELRFFDGATNGYEGVFQSSRYGSA